MAGKVAGLRALRERNFEERQKRAAMPKPDAVALITTDASATRARVSNSKAKTNTERQAKWRDGNPELARTRARDGMRKLRAKVN